MPNQIISSPFVEHPIIDISKTQAAEFDVTIFNKEQSPNFILHGKFLLNQYCTCLLYKLVNLPKSKIKPFLIYQCQQVVDPFTWLNKTEKLIDLNRDNLITKDQNIKIEKALLIIELIRQEIENQKFKPLTQYDFNKLKAGLKAYNSYEEKLSYLMEARTEYLQNKPRQTDPGEIPFDEKIILQIELLKTQHKLHKKRITANAISPQSPSGGNTGPSQKIQFNCQTNVFIDIFYQLFKEHHINGKPLLNVGSTQLADFIANNFIDKSGNPLSLHTIKTILNPSRPEKRPNAEKRIRLNIKNLP